MNILAILSVSRKSTISAVIACALVFGASKAYALGSNVVANPSVEQAEVSNPNRPANWTTNIYGTNSSTFQYLSSGYTGSRSVKVTMTSRTSGDAKWVFAPQNVTPGTSYTWSDYYQSNVTSWVVIEKIRTNGSKAWATLGSVPASTAWKKATFTFTPESNVSKVTVYHLIDRVGQLTTDNTSLATTSGTTTPPPPPVGLDKGMVSLTFDDGWRSIYVNALPLLTKYNIKSTQYIMTGPVKVAKEFTTDPYLYMMPAHVKEFHAKGHEIASHSVNHPNLTQVSIAELTYQLTESKRYLTELTGVAPKNFASPYGVYNTTTQNEIMKYYRSNRSYDGAGYNKPSNLNLRAITTRNVYRSTTTTEVKAWIDEARANKTWAVLVFHDIDPNPRQYGYTPAGLEMILQYLQATSTPVVTVDQAINTMQGL